MRRMRMKYLRYPLVALLTFIAGVVLSPIRFYVQGMGCGRVIDGGGPFSLTSYRSSYFVDILFAHSVYGSTEKANEVFDQGLREAARVVSVTSKLNKDGMPVGRRAEVVLFVPEVDKYYVNVFWTDGRFVHSIYSPSRLHVLQFEKANAR